MTPLEKFADVYLKKGGQKLYRFSQRRALLLQTNQGFSKAVISSSGNAAISAQYFCQQKILI